MYKYVSLCVAQKYFLFTFYCLHQGGEFRMTMVFFTNITDKILVKQLNQIKINPVLTFQIFGIQDPSLIL